VVDDPLQQVSLDFGIKGGLNALTCGGADCFGEIGTPIEKFEYGLAQSVQRFSGQHESNDTVSDENQDPGPS